MSRPQPRPSARVLASSLAFVLAFALAGCGDDDGGGPAMPRTDGGAGADAGGPRDAGGGADAGGSAGSDAGGGAGADAGFDPPRSVSGGEVMGRWCGMVTIAAAVTVPAGATLEVCAGSVLDFAAGAGMTVAGTLRLAGTAGGRIALGSSGTWLGLTIAGTLEGDFVDLTRATIAVEGQSASAIRLDDSTIAVAPSAFSLQLSHGGTFDRTRITGGNTVLLGGGVLRMTDSVIDLGHPTAAPDCTGVNGGGMVLDHVRFTGCHCPLHLNRTTDTVMVTNSIFDEATNPVMIANSTATFTGNHFLGVGTKMLDIGGGISANVAGNYWGGGAPDVGTSNPAQFTGTGDYATMPIAGVGPR